MFLYEILDTLKSNLPNEEIFVRPIDLLPRNVKFPMGIVINLSNSNEGGTHWVSLFINKDREGILFFN